MKRISIISAALTAVLAVAFLIFGGLFTRGAHADSPPSPGPGLRQKAAFDESVREDRQLLRGLLEMEEDAALDDLESVEGE